jgi:hypothetical protein
MKIGRNSARMVKSSTLRGKEDPWQEDFYLPLKLLIAEF